jgi:hypothetical protein
MNKIIKYLAASTLLFAGVTGCNDDSKESSTIELSLLSPSADESVDLNVATTVAFRWQPRGAEVIGGYYLVLSARSDMSNPAKFTENAPSHSFTAANLDAVIGGKGFNGWKSGEEGTLYWTVTPVSALLEVTLPEVRTLRVKRINMPPPDLALEVPGNFLDVNVAAFFPSSAPGSNSSFSCKTGS